MSKLRIGLVVLGFSVSGLHAQEDKTTKKEKRIDEVTIRASANKGAEGNIISEQKKSVEVIERVGSKQLDKQAVGDVSVAVTKATGAQKQEESGQIFIRGLGDRNNATTMNGLPIPSNDPITKNIDLSIIRTDMIDYVGLEKVYNPKMWGDVSGANIDIVSKVYTGKTYFKLNFGSSLNSNAVAQNHFYLQHGPDYFGFKPVTKPTNAAFVNSGYVFKTSWANREVFTPINSSLSVDFGGTMPVGDEGKLSVFGFGSFENNYNYKQGVTRSVDNTGNPTKDLFGNQYGYNTNSTGLINLNYRLNSKHNLKLVSNYIHTTEQNLEQYSGYIRDTNENRTEETALLRRAEYKTNDLFINQLSGEHTISSPLKIFWNLGVNRLDSRRPDRMQNISIYNSAADSHYFAASNPGANHRYFDKLIENDYVADVYAEYQLNENMKLTFGYDARFKKSDFQATQFNLRVNAVAGTYFLDPADYGSFFNSTNYNAGFFDIVTFRGDIKWNPETALIPQFYNSEVLNNAGFANLDYAFNDKFTAQLGVRYDDLSQKMNYSTSIKEGNVDKKYAKILPAFNLKYALSDTHNLRLSGSKTYTTPLLLETAPYEYEEVDELSFGNPALYPADNYNIDLKWEWFPKRSEVISLTAFGKYIQNPISRVTVNSSSNSVSFVNIGDAGRVFGVETELRKDLYQKDNTKIYAFVNGTFLHTHQQLSAEKVSAETTTTYSNTNSIDPSKTTDKMQGASDFLANVNLGIEQKWGTNHLLDFVISYSHISDNIYAIGYATKGNLVDKSLDMLDAAAKITFGNGMGFSVSGKNLLNPSFTRIQDNQNGEVLVKEHKKGRNFGAGFSYQF